MQSAQVNQANQEVLEAEKKLKAWLYPFGNKFEDALALFEKAANKYKMTKNYKEAGDTYMKMVQCHVKLNSKYDAASAYYDASQMYRKVDPKLAIDALQQAIAVQTELGKFSTAAKLEKELGELLEEENNAQDAVTHYQTAADYFDAENQKTSANQCLLKAAHLLASTGQYEEAISKFEQVANASLDEKLLKWGVREHLFKASICHLANMTDLDSGLESVKHAVEGYKDMDVHFPDSYECKLIDNVIKAMEAKDVKQFQMALKEYDNVKKLDNWQTQLFLTIKGKLDTAKKEVPDLT
jgi:alpha-soluble NSF attachment protein